MNTMLKCVAAAVALFVGTAARGEENAISGTVKTAGGKAEAGVVVAAIPLEPASTWDIGGTARTDAQGAFRITGLKPGEYALTATSTSAGAAFVEHVDSDRPVDVALPGNGRKLTGRIRQLDGKPYRGEVLMGRLSTNNGDIFITDTDKEGRFSVLLPESRYMINVVSADASLEKVVDLGTSPADVDYTVEPLFRETPAGVLAWIRKHAIPLQTAEAGHGFDDMKPLASIVGEARLVALGEATHGTREFFQLKHRMLEFLVTQMGFTVFGIEASAPDTAPVDDYVLKGTGDPGKAVAGMRFWTWNTEEVLDMVKWMRAYNADPKHTRKLRFLGFDMQNPIASVRILDAYLTKMGAEVPATTDAKAQLLDANRQAYMAKSSADQWTWIRRQVDLIRQGDALKAADSPGSSSVRDRSMAENIKWILDQQPPGTKMVVWAHNGHVTTESLPFAPEGTMGIHLRRMFGDGLRVLGFAFNRGTFQAVKVGGGGLIHHDAPPAHPASFDATLAASGAGPIFALDLKHAPREVQQWFDSPLEHRSVGAVYGSERDSSYWMRIHPAQSFDAVFFVDQMTPARGRGQAGGSAPAPPARAAVNLNFEDGQPGAAPRGWGFPQAANGYRATTEREGCAGGAQCAHVTREKETEEPFASLAQRIDATPYRGKSVRFRAKVRSKVTPPSSARLWFRVDLAAGKGIGFFDNMTRHDPGPLPEWKELEITGPVAENAEAIAFGLLFVGGGDAWIDEASLEIVGDAH